MTDSSGFRAPFNQKQFATTQWSMVLAAGESGPESNSALEQLCNAYWYPLYRFVRGRGYNREQASDLTQGFFALLIERNDFEKVRKEKGRFRSYLLASIKNFISNERDKSLAKKRGGDVATFSFDAVDAEKRYSLEPETSLTPETSFDKTWALTLLEQVQQKLKTEFDESGKSQWYERLSGYLGGDRSDLPSYQTVAEELEVSESAIKVNVHRMRKQFRKILRQEIANTVADESDIDDELNRMFEVLSK